MELIITEHPLEKPKKNICLNMIVKNEAEIIADTLENILNAIQIDYWVISDTGSTDQTKEIICDFFQKKNIPGELVEHEWKDFAYNRTKALESAFMKTDYLLIFDADDRIEGKIVLPSLINDSYMLQFGDGFRYLRSLLINNHKKWGFKGVLHEYIVERETMSNGSGIIEGNYYIISGRFGSRSKNPNKYYDDAIVLENAFYKEMDDISGDKGLACRYAFYCAQSYKDAGHAYHNDAIRWYEKVLDLNNWSQEKYYSCLMLGNLYAGQNNLDTAVKYWIKSAEYDGERIEGIVQAMECLRNKGDNIMVTMLYHKFKNYNKNVSNDKLFVDRTKYNDLIEYNNSICAYYVPGEKQSGYDCCKKIIKNNSILPIFMKSTLSNVLFYKEFIEQDTDIYICSLLLNKGQITPRFSKDLCEKSKNILFYTGYSYDDWNYSYMKNNSLGGSERAVAYLSTYLPKEYTIYVSGGVTNETVDNVIYLHLNQLQDLINTTPFHTIICSRYISFFEIFKEISFFKFYIWAHDTALLPYGCSNQQITDTHLITKWQNYIDGCICQTPWHAELYKKRFPELKEKITIINNGIDTTLFFSNTFNAKRKNKFIYTSCSVRGLQVLLELWAEILLLLPDATLVISSYTKFPEDMPGDMQMKKIIDAYPQSIVHVGKLTSEKLYQEMQSAEYWLYPTSFSETSCITAMEMLANGVICIYYPVAGLADTMKGYGFPVHNTKEILECLDYLDKLTVFAEVINDIRQKGMAYALDECAWTNRAVEWTKLLFPEKKKKEMLQIINLKRRTDRKERMINALNAQQITKYEFSEAVDGKELVPSKALKELFAGNNFRYRKGVMGCALSHYNLWQQLLDDKDNEFYLILEDDVELCKGFNKKIADLVEEMAKKDVIYLGYFRYSSAERKQVIAEFKMITEDSEIMTLQKLNANKSGGGGTFCYSINKNAAKKYIDYIDKNGIKYAMDCFMVYPKNIESYEVNPLLVISEHTFDAPVIDTDIQSQYDCLEFL